VEPVRESQQEKMKGALEKALISFVAADILTQFFPQDVVP